MGNSAQILEGAVSTIQQRVGKLVKAGSVYKTEPWGSDAPLPFLNRIIEVETGLGPSELLSELLKIEMEMGRHRTGKLNEPRTLDIDILMFGEEVIKTENLVIPHPRMHLRRFVMQPLADDWPGKIHPVLGKSSLEILQSLEDELGVEKIA